MGTGNVKRGKGKKSSAATKKAKKAKKKNTVSPFYNGHTLLRAEDREMIEMARRKQLRTSGLPVPKYPRPTTESCNEDSSSSSGSGDDSDGDDSDGSGDGSDEDMDSDDEEDDESSDGADDSGADEDENEDYDEESDDNEDYDEESDGDEEGGGGSGSSRTAAHETEYEGDCEMEDADYEGYEDDKGFFRPGTSSSSSATMRAGSCQSTNNKKRGYVQLTNQPC